MQVVPAVRDPCYPAQLRASNADAYERWTSCRRGTVVYAVLRARANATSRVEPELTKVNHASPNPRQVKASVPLRCRS